MPGWPRDWPAPWPPCLRANQLGRRSAAREAIADSGCLAAPGEVTVATRLVAPKRRLAPAAKPRQSRALSAPAAGKPCPWPCAPERGPFLGQPGAILGPPAPPLGLPLDMRQVADLIGCSPWTVRQTLIPRGLPHFRFGASGKLIFYRDQVVRWIENQQIQGGF